MLLEARDLNEMPAVANNLLEFIIQSNQKIVLFKGEMGAGKTTLINHLMHEMGVEDHVSSPTFSIVNEYFSVNYDLVYHFDFYRIEDETEAYDIGVEELFDGSHFCFIEWPEKIENLLPHNAVIVSITTDDTIRRIEVSIL
jgi:tRNA threonylcarbamoyladenosine biosynthesis protein TsaE